MAHYDEWFAARVCAEFPWVPSSIICNGLYVAFVHLQSNPIQTLQTLKHALQNYITEQDFLDVAICIGHEIMLVEQAWQGLRDEDEAMCIWAIAAESNARARDLLEDLASECSEDFFSGNRNNQTFVS